jgi:hypothetical protein
MHSRHTSQVAFAIALCCTLFIAACTNCRDRVVQRANGGHLEATVHERVCGSVAGLTVRVAPPGTPEQEGDALEFEPFQSKCSPSALNEASVSVTWTDPTHLEVRHSTDLTITRSEGTWKGASIKYVPLSAPVT